MASASAALARPKWSPVALPARRGPRLSHAAGRAHVLVTVDDRCAGARALDAAVRLAALRNACVTMIGIAPPPPLAACCAPVATPWSWETLLDASIAEVTGTSHALVGELAPEVTVEVRVVSGARHRIIRAALDRDSWLALVLPAEWLRGRRMKRTVQRLAPDTELVAA